jgi:hypothetical protein
MYHDAVWIWTDIADGYVRVELPGSGTRLDVPAPGLFGVQERPRPITETINALLGQGHRQFVVSVKRVSTLEGDAMRDLLDAYDAVRRCGGSLKVEGPDISWSELFTNGGFDSDS